MVPVVYCEQTPAFFIKNNVARMHVESNGETIIIAWPLPVFRKGAYVVQTLLAEHDAAGEVVAFPGH